MADLSDVIEVGARIPASTTINVYQVLPAPAPVAAWLRNLLAPVVVACRFRDQYPVELRPCGRYGGWAQPVDELVTLVQTAPNGFGRGVVLGWLLARHDVAAQTGIPFA